MPRSPERPRGMSPRAGNGTPARTKINNQALSCVNCNGLKGESLLQVIEATRRLLERASPALGSLSLVTPHEQVCTVVIDVGSAADGGV